MPGFSGTGPNGMGPMTGGGRGFCDPRGTGRAVVPEDYGYIPRRSGGGYGYGRGMGPRGHGGFPGWRGVTPAAYPEVTYDERGELDMLREQAELLQRDMAEINRRIGELEKKES